MRLASDNSWARRRIWSIWTGDRSELSCPHLNGEWAFQVKSHELIGAFLACPPDGARGRLLLCDECVVSHCLVARQLYLSCRFSSTDCRCFQLSNPCHEIHLASFLHHTTLTDILNQNCIFLWHFHDFVKFLQISTVSQGKVSARNRWGGK